MRYPQKESIIWQFDTAHFRVVCHVEPEDMDPADTFQFEDDIEAVRSGSVEWFCAFVSVWYGADEDVGLTYLAHDVLGGCAYKSFKDFLDRKGYFGDMVHEACRYARSEIARLKAIPAPRGWALAETSVEG